MAMPRTAAPGTAAAGGGPLFGAVRAAPEGTLTSLVYGHIRDGNYDEAIRILTLELQNFPRSRAALSLLGWCHYASCDFRSAAQAYEALTRAHPDVESYRVYHAQALYKAGLYPEALKACQRVGDSEQYAGRVRALQAAVAYEEGDTPRARALLDGCPPGDPDTLVNHACVTFKEGKYEEARKQFTEAMAVGGYAPDLGYAVSLCHYRGGAFGPALRGIAEIIDRGVREHPELSVGSSAAGGTDIRSVGNTATLRETALVEAFNLKAAIEFSVKNPDGAREALADMPPRNEDELDPVTLHNTALASMDSDPTAGFRKLNFLLSNPPFPPEAFGNLLLLYVRHGCLDLAADVMAENTHLTYRYLQPELYDFLDACIMAGTSDEEAYRRFDALASRLIDALRKHTKAVQDARMAHDNEAIKAALKLYDEGLEKYIPVLMGQAKIAWDRGNYAAVESVLKQAGEFAAEHDVWRLNFAHTQFMQEGKFREAVRFYEPLVKKSWDALLDVTAIVLANLCVAHILSGDNEAAEEVMRRVEAEEERAAAEKPGKPCFHLCIVNLVIGTLYCSKGNYEFGVSRVVKSLDPVERKLGVDTWYYAKRALLGLAEGAAKGMITPKESTLAEVIAFLDAADKVGAGIATTVAAPTTAPAAGPGAAAAAAADALDSAKHTVRHEARLLKRLFLKIRDG
jgi:tetratricopeptide repeat protein 30